MRKFWDIFLRFFLGFVIGTFIGQIVSILVSAGEGHGAFLPAMPFLTERMPDEFSAALLQFFLTGFIGAAFAVTSLVFQVERLSFLAKIGIYAAVTAVFYVPFVILCNLPHSERGIFFTALTIVLNYALVFFIQFRINLAEVQKINDRIAQRKQERGPSDERH